MGASHSSWRRKETARVEVQELEGHAGLAPLGVEVDAVGLRSRPARPRWPRVESCFEAGVVRELRDLAPRQSRLTGAAERLADRPDTHPRALGHGPVAATEQPLLAQKLSRLAHG